MLFYTCSFLHQLLQCKRKHRTTCFSSARIPRKWKTPMHHRPRRTKITVGRTTSSIAPREGLVPLQEASNQPRMVSRFVSFRFIHFRGKRMLSYKNASPASNKPLHPLSSWTFHTVCHKKYLTDSSRVLMDTGTRSIFGCSNPMVSSVKDITRVK